MRPGIRVSSASGIWFRTWKFRVWGAPVLYWGFFLGRLRRIRPAAQILLQLGARKPGSALYQQLLRHHAFQKVRGDWESGPGELRAAVWKTGCDRGRDRPEQSANRCSRYGENLHQLQASVAHRYHYFHLQEPEEEGSCQGRGGGGGLQQVGE